MIRFSADWKGAAVLFGLCIAAAACAERPAQARGTCQLEAVKTFCNVEGDDRLVAINKGACLSGDSIDRLLVSQPYSPVLVLDIEATDIEAATKTLSGYEEYMVSLLPAAPIPVNGQDGAVYACHEELCRAVFGLDGHALTVEWRNGQLSPTDAVQATMSLFREWTAPCAVATNA